MRHSLNKSNSMLFSVTGLEMEKSMIRQENTKNFIYKRVMYIYMYIYKPISDCMFLIQMFNC